MYLSVMWIRIRIHLDPDSESGSRFRIRIQIQRYKITDKMKGKAEFNQQKKNFGGNYILQV